MSLYHCIKLDDFYVIRSAELGLTYAEFNAGARIFIPASQYHFIEHQLFNTNFYQLDHIHWDELIYGDEQSDFTRRETSQEERDRINNESWDANRRPPLY